MKTFDDIVNEVAEMDWFARQMIYIRYYRRVFTSHYFSFQFCYRGMTIERIKRDFGYYPEDKWQPVSFDEFCSEDNILISDIGEDWNKHGYAQRFRKEFKLDSIHRYLYLSL